MKPRAQHTKPFYTGGRSVVRCDGSGEKCFEYIDRVEETFRLPPMQSIGHDGCRL